MDKKQFLRNRPFDEIDALDLQNFSEQHINNLLKNTYTAGILSGLNVEPNTGMSIKTNIGSALDENYNLIKVLTEQIANIDPSNVNPRYDIVSIRFKTTTIQNVDTGNKYGQGTSFVYSNNIKDGYDIIITKGTPSSSPVVPSNPSNSILLAKIFIPANSSNVSSNNIEDSRIFSDAKIDTKPFKDLKNDIKNEKINSALLKNGTQTVQGGNAPALAFPKVDGRTLINMLGDKGNLETLSDVVAVSGSILGINSVDKVIGNSSLEATTVHATDRRTFMTTSSYKIKPATRYLFISSLKPLIGNDHLLQVRERDSVSTVLADNSTTKALNGVWSTIYKKFISNAAADHAVIMGLGAAQNDKHLVDAMRLYEISAEEYAAIDSMTPEQVAARYPYVGTGIHGVKDATITAVQDNLLPPFNEWQWGIAGFSMIGAYKTALTRSGAGQNLFVDVNIIADTDYHFSIITDVQAQYELQFTGADGTAVGDALQFTTNIYKFKSPVGAVRVRVIMLTFGGANGSVTFENPMLAQGDTLQPFKPQSKTTLTAYTELHSNADGSVKDTLDYVNGKPKKVKRWEKVDLDGGKSWQFDVNYVGFKRVKIAGFLPKVAQHDGLFQMATKYDGKQLPFNGSVNTADSFFLNSTSDIFYINIPNADSGWGDAYTPTPDEIKAYFNGYRMSERFSTRVDSFNGTGEKRWFRRDRLDHVAYPNPVLGTDYFFEVPKTFLPNFAPYNLLYQLATPVIEDVQTSGAIVLESGDNHVTVNSTSVPIETASIAYANSFYSALSDVEGEVARVGEEVGKLFTSVSDGKEVVAAAITGKGKPTAANAPFQTMADNISTLPVGIDTSDANAATDDILSGKSGYVKGVKVTGTIPDHSNREILGEYNSVDPDIGVEVHDTGGDYLGVYTKPRTAGYFGLGTIIKTWIVGLTAAKVQSGVKFGPVGGKQLTGSYTSDATALVGDIVKGKTAYAKGIKLTGTGEPNIGGDFSAATVGGGTSVGYVGDRQYWGAGVSNSGEIIIATSYNVQRYAADGKRYIGSVTHSEINQYMGIDTFNNVISLGSTCWNMSTLSLSGHKHRFVERASSGFMDKVSGLYYFLSMGSGSISITVYDIAGLVVKNASNIIASNTYGLIAVTKNFIFVQDGVNTLRKFDKNTLAYISQVSSQANTMSASPINTWVVTGSQNSNGLRRINEDLSQVPMDSGIYWTAHANDAYGNVYVSQQLNGTQTPMGRISSNGQMNNDVPAVVPYTSVLVNDKKLAFASRYSGNATVISNNR